MISIKALNAKLLKYQPTDEIEMMRGRAKFRKAGWDGWSRKKVLHARPGERERERERERRET